MDAIIEGEVHAVIQLHELDADGEFHVRGLFEDHDLASAPTRAICHPELAHRPPVAASSRRDERRLVLAGDEAAPAPVSVRLGARQQQGGCPGRFAQQFESRAMKGDASAELAADSPRPQRPAPPSSRPEPPVVRPLPPPTSGPTHPDVYAPDLDNPWAN